MRISDWSSDVCSSDLSRATAKHPGVAPCTMEHRVRVAFRNRPNARMGCGLVRPALHWRARLPDVPVEEAQQSLVELDPVGLHIEAVSLRRVRSEEHTSELQSLMRISYAFFCLKKKKTTKTTQPKQAHTVQR